MSALLQGEITGWATREPARVAVVCAEESLTYGDLDRLSDGLARLLLDRGCRRGDRVALVVPKSPRAIVSMLGVLKADCVYVPIDIAGPARRVESILRSVEPALALVAGRGFELLEAVRNLGGPAVPIGSVDTHERSVFADRSLFSWPDIENAARDPIPPESSPDDPAYILFTSGSTGAPKGVVITHSNVSRFVAWALEYFEIAPSDRCSGHAPLHFDLSTFDIFGTLHAGAELHLVPHELNLLPHKMVRFIREAELTQWFSVPSVLTQMAKVEGLQQDDFPALRRLMWCGEVMPTSTLIYLMERLPHVRFTNLYGPTETTVASSYHTVSSPPLHATQSTPIGTACAGERLVILNEGLRPVVAGEVGELFIGGGGLSPGYWRDTARTAEAFVEVPSHEQRVERLYRTGDLARRDADGLVYFLGRKDSQIKRRGHRIELGEVETVLNSLGGLDEAAVVAIPADDIEGWHICCAYVVRDSLTTDDLRRELREWLPGYMLPSRWMAVGGLPRNANGKVDRPRLRELFAARDGAKPGIPPGRTA